MALISSPAGNSSSLNTRCSHAAARYPRADPLSWRAGQPYAKAAQYRALTARLGRPKSTIEFKHQNKSAIMLGLGLDPFVPCHFAPRPAFLGGNDDRLRNIERISHYFCRGKALAPDTVLHSHAPGSVKR